MPNDQVEWVSLEDVMVAAEQGLAPIGPELAGFVVLEAVLRLRELGGGVLDATSLAVGTGGHVALTAHPKPGEEPVATRALRALLGSLLEVSTSSTPALRQCARRKDHLTFAFLGRELEGALIPLNRAASRRAVARLARATLEAIRDGVLEASVAASDAAAAREESADPPPVELPTRRRSEPPPLPKRPVAFAESVEVEADETEKPPAVEPACAADDADAAHAAHAAEVTQAEETEAVESVAVAPVEVVANAPSQVAPCEPRQPTPVPAAVDAERAALHAEDVAPCTDDQTPFCAPVFELTPRAALTMMTDALEAQGPADIEIVSHLPPLVTARPPEVAGPANPADANALGIEAVGHAPALVVSVRGPDRVAQLIESFEVSRRRDDPALARDIKGWIGIETATSAPPPVKVNVRLRPRADVELDVPIDYDTPRGTVSSVPVELDSATPRRRGSLVAVLAVAVIAGATGMVAAKPSMLDAVFGPPLPPPGDLPTTSSLRVQPAAAPKVPTVCEATLTIDGVVAGSELLRRIGATPVTVTMPMHVPLDLVATMDGHAPRRAHVDASAMWKKEPTGERLDVPFALSATATTASQSWPVSNGVVPLRAAPDAQRGLLRATSTPNGADVWVVVDPSAITGVPCGAPVDLMAVPPGGPSKTLRVEWTAFTGSPPRANAKL